MMSRSGTSIFVFGVYLAILGVIFTLFPNHLLIVLNLPLTGDGWIRLVGMLLIIMAFYYLMAGVTETINFYRWTLYTRLGAVIFLVGFIVSDLISPLALLFWAGDLAGAAWTWAALRLDAKDQPEPLLT